MTEDVRFFSYGTPQPGEVQRATFGRLLDGRAPGVVFRITAEELAAADTYKVSDCKRIAVRLKSGLEAWGYVGE